MTPGHLGGKGSRFYHSFANFCSCTGSLCMPNCFFFFFFDFVFLVLWIEPRALCMFSWVGLVRKASTATLPSAQPLRLSAPVLQRVLSPSRHRQGSQESKRRYFQDPSATGSKCRSMALKSRILSWAIHPGKDEHSINKLPMRLPECGWLVGTDRGRGGWRVFLWPIRGWVQM